MKIAIIGSNGLLGEGFSRIANTNRHQIILSHYRKNIFPNSHFLDIRDNSQVQNFVKELEPDVIINTASFTNPETCEENHDNAYQTNVIGTQNLATACNQFGSHFIQISTDSVFDGKKEFYLESDKTDPVNWYGKTKLKAEEITLKINPEFCVGRTSMLFGWSKNKLNLGTLLLSKLRNKEKIEVIFDQIVSPSYNDNIANLLIEMSEMKLAGIYHVAGASIMSRYEFAQSLCDVFDLDKSLIEKTSISKFTWTAKRPLKCGLSVNKISKILSKKPFTVYESLKKMKDDERLLGGNKSRNFTGSSDTLEKRDLKKIEQFEPVLGKEEKQELLEVIDSGWFTEAKKTREFEKLFADYVGRKYAVATTSGTVALFIALVAIELKNSDEVIIPDLTFVASPNSVKMAGAKVSLVDIDQRNLCLDLDKTKELVNEKTKAIMPVDFNGRTPESTILKEYAEKNNLAVIEDACHTMGSYYKGKHMGYYSDVGIFSFATPKIITTAQGGMLVTDNQELYEKYRMIKDFGRDVDKKHNMKKAFDHIMIGYNFKFTEFQAAIGIAQMRKLPARVAHKKKMFQLYRENLSNVNGISFIDTDLKEIVPWFNDILLPNQKIRDDLIDYLSDRGIGTRMFYPSIHNLPPYSNEKGNFDNSEEISSRGLWLPSSSFISEDDIARVCDEIKSFMNSKS